jgi:hypothetical protein
MAKYRELFTDIWEIIWNHILVPFLLAKTIRLLFNASSNNLNASSQVGLNESIRSLQNIFKNKGPVSLLQAIIIQMIKARAGNNVGTIIL